MKPDTVTDDIRAQMLDHIHESVIAMDSAGYITHWNKGAERMFGYSEEEAVGRNILFLYGDEEDGNGDDGVFRAAFLEQGSREMEVRRRKKSGEVFWASLQLSLMRDADGQPTRLIGYLSDITERVKAREMLQLHARIFENSEEGILITDANLRIVSANAAFCRIMGYPAEEIVGKTPHMFQSGRHDQAFYEEMWEQIETNSSWRGELWDRQKSGLEFPVWASISAVRDAGGRVTHYFSILSDITERKRVEERIHNLAYYDALTGLPNRSLFFKLVDMALSGTHRRHTQGAILFIDLNRFKPINDTLGHAIGDHLLRQIGARLRATLRDEDIVARLGGDEFVVALFDVRSDNAGVVAQKLLSSFDMPFSIDNHDLKLGAAIGISLFPQDGSDTETLLRLADIAMYRAKQTGQDSYAYYSSEMNQKALDRLKTESGLRRALKHDELLLHYQPKVDIASGRIIGAEALVRWRHPERGMVSPGEFIPVAEESGLIVQIGAWVLETVCAQASRWHQSGLPTTRLAVNLTAREFDPSLSHRVSAVLQRHHLSPDWLELEITESMLTHSTEAVIAMMHELTHLGVSLSLDDFGTGFSSLSYLKRFPIDTLKIDRSFVTGIPHDSDDCAIAGAIVSMAKQLRHRVIAEGVERIEQIVHLGGLGCDEFQGFLFSPPVPAEQFEAMLREGRRFTV